MGSKLRTMEKLSNAQKKVREAPLGKGLLKKASMSIKKKRRAQAKALRELGF